MRRGNSLKTPNLGIIYGAFSKLRLGPTSGRSHYIIEILADVMRSEISAQGDRVCNIAYLTVYWHGFGQGIPEIEASIREPRTYDAPDPSLCRKRVGTTVATDMGEDAE